MSYGHVCLPITPSLKERGQCRQTRTLLGLGPPFRCEVFPVPPCRQVAPQARAESQCEPGPTSWIFLFFLPLCNVAGEGKCQAERKTACAVPTVQGGEILDCSIVTSRCVTESTSSSSHAGEDQAYSHHYSASKIQASNPFISLTKDRKPPLRGSGGSLALSLCLSRCAGASRTWAP